jgi:hypothetical protein
MSAEQHIPVRIRNRLDLGKIGASSATDALEAIEELYAQIEGHEFERDQLYALLCLIRRQLRDSLEEINQANSDLGAFSAKVAQVMSTDNTTPINPADEETFPQRHEEVLTMLLERLDLVQAKFALALSSEGGSHSTELVLAECSKQLGEVYCRLNDWRLGSLTRADMEATGFDVDDIQDESAEPEEMDD